MPDAPFDAFRYAHAHRTEIAWLSQNTNHLVPPEVVGPALLEAIAERRYAPYPYAPGDPELKELVLNDLGLDPGAACLVTAGGTESLYMLTRALLAPGDEVVASDPSYLIIHKFVELAGARTINVPIYAPPYRLTAEAVQAALTPKTKMILLIDPLNPLGSGYPREEVRAIAEIAHDRRLLLLNDITYRDFSESHTLAATFAPEQSLTVWSVSKNCGLAGLRLGGITGPSELIARVNRFNTNDLGVNILAQVAAVAALRTKSRWFPAVLQQSRQNQRRIRDVALEVPGVTVPVYPSQANMFVLDIEAAGVAPDDLQRELLLQHGVFVRAGSYLSPTFGRRFVRASFSNPPSDIERFATSFGPAMAAVRSRSVAPSAAPTAH